MFNAINWFEIPAKDFDRAVSFYDAILPRSLRRGEFGGIPHGFLSYDDNAVGGAVVLNPSYEPSTNGPVLYLIAGSDIQAVIDRVKKAGGTVVMPVTDITPQGYIAMILDSEGNRVALHQPPIGE